jgi:hypothetical protein
VLVVNSPGGSPVQSSLIGHRIRALADEKQVPVNAVAEDAAASGGSWVACVADEIVADPGSIIGSIGVVSAGFGDAIGRIGVERRIRAAGAEKSILDPFRAETPAERERLDEMLAALHAEFIGWVEGKARLGRGRRTGSLGAGGGIAAGGGMLACTASPNISQGFGASGSRIGQSSSPRKPYGNAAEVPDADGV